MCTIPEFDDPISENRLDRRNMAPQSLELRASEEMLELTLHIAETISD
jgi:hypothetical protein